MRAEDLLRKKGERIVHVRPGTKLKDAMRLMAKEHVGTVLLMDDAGDMHGIISERDFVRIFTEHGPKAHDFPVCDLVRRDVIVCNEDATLHDLITLMSNNGIRHMPVMREGRIAGMVSARDVLDAQKDVLLQVVKRHKQALNLAIRAKGRAEESDHQKTEFLHRMSHELRTPLNAIIGFSGMIEAEALGPVGSPKYKEYSAEIGNAGTNLLTIINEILEMSRLEMGAYRASEDIVDMNLILHDSVSQFDREAARKSILMVAQPSMQPTLLTGDRNLVAKMVGHVVSNAVKFTPPGGRVWVEVGADEAGGIRLDVTDTGPGIPADKIEWVTKPFYCVEEALTQSNEGAGLGLALTNAMIALHQGSLKIASEFGKGTTVALSFPRERRHVTSVTPLRQSA